MARILAIDYGEKKSGLAVSDPMKIIASSLTTIQTETLYSYIDEYVGANEVETIVVGYPKTLSNKPAIITPMIDHLADKLSEIYPNIRIVKYDERFTSKIASNIILQSGIGKQRRKDKSLVDKISATIILQDYMESIR